MIGLTDDKSEEVAWQKGSVLREDPCDKLDSPAIVIQSLFQADPFPCSVASLGRADLFKALEPSSLR